MYDGIMGITKGIKFKGDNNKWFLREDTNLYYHLF